MVDWKELGDDALGILEDILGDLFDETDKEYLKEKTEEIVKQSAKMLMNPNKKEYKVNIDHLKGDARQKLMQKLIEVSEEEEAIAKSISEGLVNIILKILTRGAI